MGTCLCFESSFLRFLTSTMRKMQRALALNVKLHTPSMEMSMSMVFGAGGLFVGVWGWSVASVS